MSGLAQALPLVVVGCDFRRASSSWRSRLVLCDQEILCMARMLRDQKACDGLVALTTCNRTEWIASTPDPRWATTLLANAMADRLGPQAKSWFSPYIFAGEDAARHIFAVALGKESLVIGERQIASQLQQALKKSQLLQVSSRVLNGLATVAGRLVRRAARNGYAHQASVGVHSLVIAYLASRLDAKRCSRVAVIGMGQVGRRLLGLLEQDSRFEPVCVNKTVVSHDSKLARLVRRWHELPEILVSVDAAVVCTSAPRPILGQADLSPRSAGCPLLVVDVGIPEQVERAQGAGDSFQNVRLVGLDELTVFHQQRQVAVGDSAIEKSLCARAGGASPENQYELLVQKALVELRTFIFQPPFSPILKEIQKNHLRIVGEEIPRIMADHLRDLPKATRAKLSQTLHAVLLDYRNNLLQTIRKASEHFGENRAEKRIE